MKMKTLMTTLIFSVSILMVPHVYAGEIFPDLEDNHWSTTFFTELKEKKIFQGDKETGNIRPGDTLNRAEAITLILRTLGIDPEPAQNPSPFWDVIEGDWFYAGAIKGNDLNIVTGYKDAAGRLTGEFGPQNSVSRAEFSMMIFRAFKLQAPDTVYSPFVDISSHWAKEAIETLWAYSIVNGVSESHFDPNRPITRAEAAKILSMALNPSLRDGYNINNEVVVEDGEEEEVKDKIEDKTEVKEGEGTEGEGTEGEGTEGEGTEGEGTEGEGTEGEGTEGEGTEEGETTLEIPESVQRMVAPGDPYLAGYYMINPELEPFLIKTLSFAILGSPYDGYFNDTMLYYPTSFENPDVLDGKKNGSIVDNKVVFEGLDFAADEDQKVLFPLVFVLNSIDNVGESGKIIDLQATSANPGEFKAIGKYSDQEIATFPIDNTQAKRIVIRKSYPIFTEKGEIRNLVLSPETIVYQFKVEAHSSGDIGLKRLSFQISSEGLDVSVNGLGGTWKLYRTDISSTGPLATATLNGDKVVFDFAEQEIFASESHEYEVRAPLSSIAGSDTQVLSIRLAEDTIENADSVNNDNTGTVAEVDANSLIIWSDQSSETHSELTADWTNSFLIPGLPFNYVSLQ